VSQKYPTPMADRPTRDAAVHAVLKDLELAAFDSAATVLRMLIEDIHAAEELLDRNHILDDRQPVPEPPACGGDRMPADFSLVDSTDPANPVTIRPIRHIARRPVELHPPPDPPRPTAALKTTARRLQGQLFPQAGTGSCQAGPGSEIAAMIDENRNLLRRAKARRARGAKKSRDARNK